MDAPGARNGGRLGLLNDLNDRLLTRLGDPPDGGVCAGCLATGLGIERWDALKGIRDLILAGQVVCAVEVCSSCRNRELVALRRRPSVS